MKQFLLALLIVGTASLGFAQETTESKLFKDLGKAVYITQITDIISTEISLAQGNYEQNVLMKNRAVRIPAKLVGGWAVNKLTADLYKTHPKAAILIRLGTVCATTYFTTRNLQLSYSVRF